MSTGRLAALGELGLGAYQARVLLALLERPDVPLNYIELAELSGVPRTSIYGACKVLVALDLIERVPTTGVARWRAPGWIRALDALEQRAARQFDTELDALARVRAEVGA